MTADQLIQLGTEVITLATIVFTYLGTRKSVGKVNTVVNGNHDQLVNRVDQLGQSIQEQGGTIPPRPPRTPAG